MNATSKKKLCWNCEGNVTREAVNCPFCGVYLQRAGDNDEREEEDFSPPYKLVGVAGEEESLPKAPYTPENGQVAAKIKAIQNDDSDANAMKMVVMSLLCLLAGSFFLMFGIILALFARDGIFTLRWNADYWYFYLATALPLLFLGWRALSKLQ